MRLLWLYIFLPFLVVSCVHPSSLTAQREATRKPSVQSNLFLIHDGSRLNHPYKGSAFASGKDEIVVVFENWINATALPFESHLMVSKISRQKVIQNATPLDPNEKTFSYNPHFVSPSKTVDLILNVYNSQTQKSSFERRRFDFNRGQFDLPMTMKVSDDLSRQYRAWVFPSSLDRENYVLTYEWKDPISKKNRLKMAESRDGLHFQTSIDMGTGVMPRHLQMLSGQRVFTYQNAIADKMMDFFRISSDGIKWTDGSPVSSQKNVHDLTPFQRKDGGVDFYYVATGAEDSFSVFRRSLDRNGKLGVEQEITKKSDGSFMQPHPTRLPDGTVFLVLTKETEPQVNYDLMGAFLDDDAP